MKTNDLLSASENSTYPLTIFLFVLAGLIGGLVAILTLSTLIWLSNRKYAIDFHNEHGISSWNSSRLGGIAVISSTYFYLSGGLILEHLQLFQVRHPDDSIFLGYEWVAIGIGFIGLLDDFKFHTRPAVRLGLMFLFVCLSFEIQPSVLPTTIYVPDFDLSFESEIVVYMICLLTLIGFVNAGNIADGANGLLASIFGFFFMFGLLLTDDITYWALGMSVLTFALYNIFTGKIFLGDFGAYTLSSLAVLCCLDWHHQYNVSIWFFASILSYPCVEIIHSIVKRLISKGHVLKADEGHFHNKLNSVFTGFGFNPLVANSATGASIGVFFSGIPFTLYYLNIFELSSERWFYMFLFFCSFHLVVSSAMSNIANPSR